MDDGGHLVRVDGRGAGCGHVWVLRLTSDNPYDVTCRALKAAAPAPYQRWLRAVDACGEAARLDVITQRCEDDANSDHAGRLYGTAGRLERDAWEELLDAAEAAGVKV